MWKQLYKKNPSPGSQKSFVFLLPSEAIRATFFFSFYHAYKVCADISFFLLWPRHKDSEKWVKTVDETADFKQQSMKGN